jgi:hypothetical protein
VIDTDQHILGERLLLEQISRHGISRAVGVSIRWLIDCTVACYDTVTEHACAQLPRQRRDVILRRVAAEAGELCSFVQKQANKPWLWLATEQTTCQLMAFHMVDCSMD